MVEQYILKHKQWQAEIDFLRAIVLKSGLQEEIKWGAPTYTLKGKNIVGLSAFKSYVGLWFFQGATLKDEQRVLINAQEGKTKAMRQWRFTSLDEMDETLISLYIKEAIENHHAGIKVSPQRRKEVELSIPPELVSAFANDSVLEEEFNGLTPYKQKEYCEYISEAKRAATKLSRLEKIRPMIKEGQGLNDRYR